LGSIIKRLRKNHTENNTLCINIFTEMLWGIEKGVLLRMFMSWASAGDSAAGQ